MESLREEPQVIKDDSSIKSRELKISGVQLKILGEALNVLQEFKQKLELGLSCEGVTCRVCFVDGKFECLHISHAA